MDSIDLVGDSNGRGIIDGWVHDRSIRSLSKHCWIENTFDFSFSIDSIAWRFQRREKAQRSCSLSKESIWLVQFSMLVSVHPCNHWCWNEIVGRVPWQAFGWIILDAFPMNRQFLSIWKNWQSSHVLPGTISSVQLLARIEQTSLVARFEIEPNNRDELTGMTRFLPRSITELSIHLLPGSTPSIKHEWQQALSLSTFPSSPAITEDWSQNRCRRSVGEDNRGRNWPHSTNPNHWAFTIPIHKVSSISQLISLTSLKLDYFDRHQLSAFAAVNACTMLQVLHVTVIALSKQERRSILTSLCLVLSQRPIGDLSSSCFCAGSSFSDRGVEALAGMRSLASFWSSVYTTQSSPVLTSICSCLRLLAEPDRSWMCSSR